MNKRLLAVISLALALVMILGVLASCGGGNKNNESTTDKNEESTSEPTGGTESSEKDNKDTEESTDKGGSETDDKDPEESTDKGDSETSSEGTVGGETESETLITGDNAALIELSNKLANGVNPHYTDAASNELTISNLNMDLGYNMTTANGDLLVSHLSTKDGHAYIRNTMDTFVRMKDGSEYYNGKCVTTTKVTYNAYRYGYYYYENRLEGQTFINAINKNNIRDIRLSPNPEGEGSHSIKLSGKVENGFKYQIDGSDPYVSLGNISFSTENYDYLEVTIKATGATGSGELYIIAGKQGAFSTNQVKSFGVINDGEAHTYRFYLGSFKDYTGNVRGIRFDVDGAVGSEVEISNLKIYKGDYGNAPTELTVQRSFITYSDKLHHVLQVSAKDVVEDIQVFGMYTTIPEDMVNAIVIKDRQGFHYDLSKIAWATVEYVGFDIKDAGIFGYILPYDGSGGTLRVSLADGVYTVEQRKAPDGAVLNPSDEGTRNKNDFFMGQRIYTDTYHTFDKFIYEAECERNPLTEENIIVDKVNSDNGNFVGYDALYGYYKFSLSGTGFNQAYFKFPNKHYTVKFKVIGDKYDRQMYFMTYTPNGGLECAAILDEKQMMLPIPMEVAKNFAGDGENTIYNLDDASYGEVFFPMIVNAGETREYTVLNLYQNWGKYPLKQISSIQYHVPYYHLSTGVTETNCIVPFAVCGPGLPDHRAMSAPFWKSQPQHTSGGGHSWLRYNDATGIYIDSQTNGVKIDSYGPIYCDITLDWITADGKMAASYTHTEIPQTDENRAFYEMKYTVLEDIEINDFKNNFTFYYVTDNNATGTYKKIGYLDNENEYQVADAANADYVLGDECPYFSFFMMPDWNRNSTSAEGYVNLAFLIYNYEIIINGEKVNTSVYLRNRTASASLSFNLDDVVLKKGDTITINAILLPWGSQELEDDPANRLNKSHVSDNFHGYTYSSVLEDGKLYMDKNVRDVRENTLLNPFKATADKDCEIMDYVFIPKIKSTNGKSAEFTVSGGTNNCAVRVYGFDMLSVPKVEEFVDGEWKTVVLNSSETEDAYGYSHHYDGYGVHYDGDGTYSYSFITEMDAKGSPRKFRVTVDEEFKGWPEKPVINDIIEDPINFFLQPSEILQATVVNTQIAGALLSKDRSHISLSGHASAAETYMHFFNNDKTNPKVTGQYVVVKYRVPTGMNNVSQFEFFTTTDLSYNAATVDHRLETTAHTDDQWHVLIVNLADALKDKSNVFVPNENGEYVASFVRWDIFSKVSADMYIDVAYFGIHDNLEDIYAMELDKTKVPTETPKYVELVEGGKTLKIDPKTGETYVPTYIDPTNEQGYKVSDVEYASYVDYINRVLNQFGMHNDKTLPTHANPTKQTIGDGLLVLTGWCVAEGGVEKYVWSADGGKTWHDVVMYNDIPLQGADNAMITAFGSIKKYTDADGKEVIPTVTNDEASRVNGSFSGNKGICANLADYYETGTTVSVTFAAVPKADTSSLCLIAHITNVEVFIAPPIAPSETVNLPLTPEAIHNKVVEKASNYTFLSSVLSEDKSVVRFNAKADAGDQYGLVMNGNTTHTGQYLYLKYKLPTGYSTHSAFQIYTSTVNGHFQGSGDNFTINGLIQDNEWHVVIVDVSQKLLPTMFGRSGEGRYVAKYLRVDVFEQKASEGMYAEFAAMGFADNLDVIYKEICSDMEFVTVIGSSTQKIDPATGKAFVRAYIDPTNAQGYTKSSVEFAGYIDMVNGKGGNKGTEKAIRSGINSTKAVFEFFDHCGTTLEGTQLLTFSGWVVVNGGIEKYVWSADGGKTWNDVQFYINQGFANAGDAHLQQLEAIGAVITDRDSTIKKALFQGAEGGGATTAGIAANLSAYAGQKVNVTFAAVPKTDTDGLCILLYVSGVQVPETAAAE